MIYFADALAEPYHISYTFLARVFSSTASFLFSDHYDKCSHKTKKQKELLEGSRKITEFLQKDNSDNSNNSNDEAQDDYAAEVNNMDYDAMEK